MKKVTDKEIKAVIKLPPDERYEYGLKMIVDWEEMWSLKSGENWVRAQGQDGSEHFLVWPHLAYARACAKGAWDGATPAKIPLQEWFDVISEQLTDEEMGISFFPVPMGNAFEVTLERFAEDLEAEMDKYG